MHATIDAHVEAPVSYIERSPGKPYSYEYDPPPGVARRSATYRAHRVRIRDARTFVPAPALDTHGFTLCDHASRVSDFYDDRAVTHIYYAEIEQLVREATGASVVVAFDHNVRGNEVGTRNGVAVHEPVSRVHNDYTAQSALRRARQVARERGADALLAGRIVQVNAWRPIRGPLQTRPLAVVDARTLQAGDLVACDLIYPDRLGEVYYLAHDPGHSWYYYPDMRRSEVLLLKGFDSDASHARFAPHVSFAHPQTPTDAPPRESIEVRTFGFFD